MRQGGFYSFSIWQNELRWQAVDFLLVCVDIRLALMEMRVTLSKLIWHYDFTLKDVGQEVPAYNHLTISAGRLELRVKRVEREQHH
jgi:hypothetical protein